MTNMLLIINGSSWTFAKENLTQKPYLPIMCVSLLLDNHHEITSSIHNLPIRALFALPGEKTRKRPFYFDGQKRLNMLKNEPRWQKSILVSCGGNKAGGLQGQKARLSDEHLTSKLNTDTLWKVVLWLWSVSVAANRLRISSSSLESCL